MSQTTSRPASGGSLPRIAVPPIAVAIRVFSIDENGTMDFQLHVTRT